MGRKETEIFPNSRGILSFGLKCKGFLSRYLGKKCTVEFEASWPFMFVVDSPTSRATKLLSLFCERAHHARLQEERKLHTEDRIECNRFLLQRKYFRHLGHVTEDVHLREGWMRLLGRIVRARPLPLPG